MRAKVVMKTNQEQAVASWINYLNQVRLDRFTETLNQERTNLDNAINIIEDAIESAKVDIINNGAGRGGEKGMHGFIAEIAEVGLGNARDVIEGRIPSYAWVGNNKPMDIFKDSQAIQMKFTSENLSLQAVANHLEKYPDYISNGGTYMIPSDHYEKIKHLLSISEDEANKIAASTGKISLNQWKKVHEFFSQDKVPFDRIEPSNFKYGEVQQNTYERALKERETALVDRNKERRAQAYQESRPSFHEGAKATMGAAAIEGMMALCMGMASKLKKGKRIQEFTESDWKEIAKDTGKGISVGVVRGSIIYVMTNFTATPAFAASAIVSASLSVAEQTHSLRTGAIDEQTFIKNAEIICLDASVCAASSLIGQVMIPVPVLGALIGNTVGSLMYQVAKDGLNKKEQIIIKQYLDSIDELNKKLDKEYLRYVRQLSKEVEQYMLLVSKAFAIDAYTAYKGSIELARYMNVPNDKILDSEEKSFDYFMN